MSDGTTLDDHLPGTAANHGGERECTDNSASTSCSNTSVANSLNLLISSVITGFERTADATSRSQDQVSSALDRLTGELDNLLEDAPSTFIMQHSARIAGVRKRVRALNSVLKSIQQRMDNMDRMISAGLMRDKLVSQNSLENTTHSSQNEDTSNNSDDKNAT